MSTVFCRVMLLLALLLAAAGLTGAAVGRPASPDYRPCLHADNGAAPCCDHRLGGGIACCASGACVVDIAAIAPVAVTWRVSSKLIPADASPGASTPARRVERPPRLS